MDSDVKEEVKWSGVDRRRHHDRNILLGTSIFCFFIILGVLAFGVVNTNNRARESEDVSKRIGACVLAELSYHRERADFINRKVSERLGFDYPLTGSQYSPEDLSNSILTACEEFTKE